MRKGIITKGQMYDFRSYIDVDIEKNIIKKAPEKSGALYII